MPGALVAVSPTPLVTLQDAGRVGWQRFGVSRAGAMDVAGLAAANALLGNPPQAAALEFAHAAGAWRVDAISARVAVAGGRFAVTVDGAPVPPLSTVTLLRGQVLRIGGAPDAVWGYLAAEGGFAVAPQLGSRSVHVRSAIGSLGGRPIRAGDAVPLAQDWVRAQPERALPLPAASATPSALPIRVVLGPQQEYFRPAVIRTFLGADYAVTHQMDRLGYRLSGPTLEHAKGYNIISDGIVPGCIQVPGSGAPIVLLRDAQPPGGYPKIATVISADLGRFVQSRPGQKIRFRRIELAAAQQVRAAFLQELAMLGTRVAEVPPKGLPGQPA
jgi:biotin-dependent carboxylase-like uncharacterized protein